MTKSFIFSTNSVISWAFKVSMLIFSGIFLLGGDLLLSLFSLIALSISLIPALVNHSHDTNLPWTIDFLLTVWLALSVAGTAGLYQEFSWWDNLLHFGGTAVLAYLAFVLIYALNFTGKLRLSIPFIGFFTLLIGIAFGALWELLEFWTWQVTGRDALTGTGSLPAGILDTFSDMQLNLLGSILVAIGGMQYVARQRHIYLHEWMQPFVKIFGEKIRKVKKVAKQRGVELKQKVHSGKLRIKRKLKKQLKTK